MYYNIDEQILLFLWGDTYRIKKSLQRLAVSRAVRYQFICRLQSMRERESVSGDDKLNHFKFRLLDGSRLFHISEPTRIIISYRVL
jgi:hypothetical protein